MTNYAAVKKMVEYVSNLLNAATLDQLTEEKLTIDLQTLHADIHAALGQPGVIIPQPPLPPGAGIPTEPPPPPYRRSGATYKAWALSWEEATFPTAFADLPVVHAISGDQMKAAADPETWRALAGAGELGDPISSLRPDVDWSLFTGVVGYPAGPATPVATEGPGYYAFVHGKVTGYGASETDALAASAAAGWPVSSS